MALSAITVNKYLANINHYDKDERYMCLSDLTNEMAKLPADARLDAGSEKKVVAAVADRLEKDSSPDVQAIAVKCLSVLVTRMSETGVSDASEKLMTQIITGKAELRDVYAIGLKTVISEVPALDSMAAAITRVVVPRLLATGLRIPSAGGGVVGAGGGSSASTTTATRADVRAECIDVTNELVRRFGDRMMDDIPHLMKVLSECVVLETSPPAVRKRATSALGTIAPHLNDALLEQLIVSLLSHLDSNAKKAGGAGAGGAGKKDADMTPRAIIQTMGAMSRQVGHRLGRHLIRIVPIFLSYLGTPDVAAEEDSGNSESANELRENILSAFENFFGAGGAGAIAASATSTSSVPSASSTTSSAGSGGSGSGGGGGGGGDDTNALASYRDAVIKTCLSWMSFDPNYNYGDDDDSNNEEGNTMDDSTDDNGDGGDEDEDYGNDGDDGDYGDADDDTSWKSRRAAVRVLTAIVESIRSKQIIDVSPSAAASLLHSLYSTVSTPVIRRFKEREEGVRLEVVACAHSFAISSHVLLGKLAGVAGLATSSSSSGDVGISSSLTSASSSFSPVSPSGNGGSGSTAAATLDIDNLASGLGKAALPVHAAHIGNGAVAAASSTSGLLTGPGSSSFASSSLSSSSSMESGGAGSGEASIGGTSFSDLFALIEVVLKRSSKLLKAKDAKSVKTRSALLRVLRTFVLVADDDMVSSFAADATTNNKATTAADLFTPFLPALTAAMITCMTDRTQQQHSVTLRLEANHFCLALLLAFSRAPKNLAPYVKNIVPAIVASGKDDYFRVVANSMRVAAVMATILRPAVIAAEGGGGGSNAGGGGAGSSSSIQLATEPIVPASSASPLFSELAKAIVSRLQSHDIDQEIKEGAITAAGALLAHGGDVAEVASHVPAIVRLFGDRLKSDTTRAHVLRAMAYVSASPLGLVKEKTNTTIADFITNTLFPECAGFMRQMSRPLRTQTLETLAVIVKYQGAGSLSFTSSKGLLDALHKVLLEISQPSSLNDSDLHMLQLSFEVGNAILEVAGTPADAKKFLADTLLKRAVELSCASGIQGAGLSTLLSMLETGVKRECFDTASVVASILSNICKNFNSMNRAGLWNASKCIAIVLSASSSSSASTTKLIQSFLTDAVQGEVVGPSGGRTMSSGGSTSTISAFSAPAGVLTTAEGSHVSLPVVSRFVLSELGRSVDILAINKNAISLLMGLLKSGPATARSGSSGCGGGGAGGGGAAMGAGGGATTSAATAIEDARVAASLALGGVVAGNLAAGIPMLLSAIASSVHHDGQQSGASSGPTTSSSSSSTSTVTGAADAFGLLRGLREAIGRHSPMTRGGPEFPLGKASLIVESIMGNASLVSGSEESLRNLVAECVGRLLAAAPSVVVPRVMSTISSSTSPNEAKWTAITAIRFSISASSAAAVAAAGSGVGSAAAATSSSSSVSGRFAPYLTSSVLTDALSLLTSDDLNVRHAALSTVNALAHGALSMLRPFLLPVACDRFKPTMPAVAASDSSTATATTSASPVVGVVSPPVWPTEGVLAVIYYECFPRADLMREINLGPFVHKVDDGVPLRKSAFSTMDTLLERSSSSSSMGLDALHPLLSGLLDPTDDVRVLAHSIFQKACEKGFMTRLLATAAAITTEVRAELVVIDGVCKGIEGSLNLVPNQSGQFDPAQVDMARVALRSLLSFATHVPGVLTVKRAADLVLAVERREPLATLFDGVRMEK